ncbi:MAG: hypothetical protein JSW27_21935, partial [Phycisphaerales bacterium]
PVGEACVYHMPCHLSYVGDDSVYQNLLHDDFKVGNSKMGAGCCGLSGTFGMQKKNYELSDRIADGLKGAIKAASTQNVLTECAACKMQIEHVASAPVTHPIKLIAQAYDL